MESVIRDPYSFSNDLERTIFIEEHLTEFMNNHDRFCDYIIAFDSDYHKVHYLNFISDEYKYAIIFTIKDIEIREAVIRTFDPFHRSSSIYEDENIAKNVFASNAILYADKRDEVLSKTTIKPIEPGIPEDYTFGVELELERGLAYKLRNCDFKPFGKWGIVYDSSLDLNSVEITSPILHYTEEDMKELEAVCNFAKENGMGTSSKTGTHIHVGLNAFKSPEALICFYKLLSRCEFNLYLLVNDYGEVPRDVLSTAMPLFLKKYKDNYFTDLDGLLEPTMEDTIANIAAVYQNANRQTSVNILPSIEKNTAKRKPTIEFRLANGTVDPDTIRHNMMIYAAMISTANTLCSFDKEMQHKILENISTTNGANGMRSLINLLFHNDKEKEYFMYKWYTNMEALLAAPNSGFKDQFMYCYLNKNNGLGGIAI